MASTSPPDNAVHPETRAAWHARLARHHARGEGVWLVEWKTATGRPRVGYDAAVEEALCFGSVDGRVNALDAERSLLWFAPRKPRTGWSAPNKDRVERMIAARLMTAAGLAKAESGKADGTWSKLDAVEAPQAHEDLAAALAAHPPAATPWGALPRAASGTSSTSCRAIRRAWSAGASASARKASGGCRARRSERPSEAASASWFLEVRPRLIRSAWSYPIW
jgi:uncharacterized protein YdeI (YjbR/CyaY-like superfamily)